MKKLYTVIIGLILTVSVFAQAPQKTSYQAVVRDASNNLTTNQAVGMQISILQGSATGTVVYVETQTPTTNANGLVSLEIGTGTVVSGDFTTIDWANGTYFIKTETDPTGGITYTITGTTQLMSVPYALHAKTASSITGGITETQNLDNVLTLGNDGGAKQIKNILDPTDPQDAVTKSYLDQKINQIIALNQGVTDIDGNHYNSVLIGNQIWMATNLKVSNYPNGDAISYIDNNVTWGALADNDTDDAYSFYGDSNNDGTIDIAHPDYGALYTYSAAIADNWARDNSTTNSEGGQGICPDGWHLPTDAEWTTLTTFLGGLSVAGGKMKETGTTHWSSPNTGATNSSGFTALPSGGRGSLYGTFYNIGNNGAWWSGTEGSSSLAYYRSLNYGSANATRISSNKSFGFCVRCIRD